MTPRAMLKTWTLSLAIVGLLILGGCGQATSQQTITLQSVLDDMSPNFDTIALSQEQVLVRRARTLDTNARQIQDDLDDLFLMRRPLRLSIYTIP